MTDKEKKELPPITMGDPDTEEAYEHDPVKLQGLAAIGKVSEFLEHQFPAEPFRQRIHGADMVARLIDGKVMQGEIDIFLLTMKDGHAESTGFAGGGSMIHRWVEKDGWIIDGFLNDLIIDIIDREKPRKYAAIPIIIRRTRRSEPVDVLYSNVIESHINTTEELFAMMDGYLAERTYPETLKGQDMEGVLDERGLERAGRYWVWAQGAFYTDHHGEPPTRQQQQEPQEGANKPALQLQEEQIVAEHDEPGQTPPPPMKKEEVGPSLEESFGRPPTRPRDIGDDIIDMTRKKPLRAIPSIFAVTGGVAVAYAIAAVFS